MSNNYQPRRESSYYDAEKAVFTTRNMDVAAYLELKLGESAEASLFENSFGDKVEFKFTNCLQIRDLLEVYDRGEAQVEPRQYSEIKIRLINKRKELLHK